MTRRLLAAASLLSIRNDIPVNYYYEISHIL
jgi:hypothetical protein